jgi:hypothetical protein
VLLTFCCAIIRAQAGHIYHNTRVWAVQGPGGLYGLVESQGDVSIEGHVVYETTVEFGPLRFGLPCRAPFAVFILVAAFAFAGWLLYSLFANRRRHDIGESQAFIRR